MKAGTAQRITLSLLSSLLMIRLGRVYEGLMVDVQATNQKLTKRSENMLIHLTGRNVAEVQEALARAGGSVKLAVVLLQGCPLEEAKALLQRCGGRLRVALAEFRESRSLD
jgi:N-acetylmuramic acid 6-phosphate etherase